MSRGLGDVYKRQALTSEQRGPVPARAHSDDFKSQKPASDIGRFWWSRIALLLVAAAFVIAVGYFALPKTEDLDPTLDLQFPSPRSENLCYVGASI